MMNTAVVMAFLVMFHGLEGLSADQQYWNSVVLSSKASEKTDILGEIIHRYSDESKEFTVRSVRLGASYKLSDKWNLAALLESRNTNSAANDEIRWIQQLSTKVSIPQLALGLRGRYELREFSNTRAFSQRVRLQVRGDFPGLKISSLRPFLAYEHFYVLNSVVDRPAGAQEARSSIGFTIPVFGGDLDISAMARSNYTPAIGEVSAQTKYSQILNLVGKWAY